MTTLPMDSDSNPIPALRLKPGGAHSINATDTSARNATGFQAATRVVSVYATAPVRLAFGGADVTATVSDHYFPSGVYYDFAIGGGKTMHTTHLAVLADNVDCTVYVSEKH